LPPQAITVPTNATAPLFVDVDEDGRADLLVIDRVKNTLLNYHQRSTGFTNAPDQVISLPRAAWVAPVDVETHPGLELVISTSEGLIYSRQNGGLFEAERHGLIEAQQVFTNKRPPLLTLISNRESMMSPSLPVITATNVARYQRDAAYHWTAGESMTLEAQPAAWSVEADANLWRLGHRQGKSVVVRESFRAKPDEQIIALEDRQAVERIVVEMKKSGTTHPGGTNVVDVNGDGRKDVVLWQASGGIDFKTEIYVLLRGADQRLPVKPSQTLRCRGFPIPSNSTSMENRAVVIDLGGDGTCELVLLEPRVGFASPSTVLEAALSHGLDWALTIRTFNGGAFSANPAATLPITAVLPFDDFQDWPLFIQGDFNGDKRPDLLVRRSETQWNIFTSTRDGHWFAPQPTLTFEAPRRGHPEPRDLNGDGIADIVWHEPDGTRLSILMSPPVRTSQRK
jgi:hypothetical protein